MTFNEEPNLVRTLDSLRWARRVVVLDSGSTDETEQIARAFSNVSWHFRKFDDHRAQWEHGIFRTGIDTDFILALDADMAVSRPLLDEMRRMVADGRFAGALVPFEYRLCGHPLLGSLYAPQVRLFRRDAVRVEQRGHTQEFQVEGPIYRFRARIVHDDRKPLERWVASQVKYSALEASRVEAGRSRFRDRLRQWGIMPPIAAAIAYVRAGGPFGGAAAAGYAYERAVYECLLGIRLMSDRIGRTAESAERHERAGEGC